MPDTSPDFTITNHTKAKLPRLAFAQMKEAVLGNKYTLEVAIVSLSEIKRLNRHYRDIDKPTDILSFPLSKTEGEIYVNLAEAKKECKKFGRPYENFIGFLFIHGLVHLKGFDHGSTMERIEARFQKKFGFFISSDYPRSLGKPLPRRIRHTHRIRKSLSTLSKTNGTTNDHRNRHRYLPR